MFLLGNHLYRLFSKVDKIRWKKSIHFTSFPKEIFSTYFEDNSIETHEPKNIKRFSSIEHGPKSDKSASAFLKLYNSIVSTCVKSAKEMFFSIFIEFKP